MSWTEDPGWESFEGLSLRDLSVDEAYVKVTSYLSIPTWLYTLSEECYKCPFSLWQKIDSNSSQVHKLSTKHGTFWKLLTYGKEIVPLAETSSAICDMEPSLGEFGVYDFVISNAGSGVMCSLVTRKKPVNIYLPLVLWLLVLLAIWFLYGLASTIVTKWFKHKKNQTASASDTQQSSNRQRLKSLDTFRGISIVLMIFVNDGAGGYWFLEHATWNGLQIADVLFPWFMWIMGVCIPISIKSQLKKGVPRFSMFINVVRRACILFLLGLILNSSWGAKLETLRVFGVLQRFGIVYLVVATLSICFTCRSYKTYEESSFMANIQDILVLLPQWIVIIGIVAGHCFLTFYLEVPGCPTGYLGPGGIQDDARYRDCIGGATGYVDRLILGEKHIYQHPTASEVYHSGPFDPEGIVGCLLSVFQVFLGVQAGTTLSFHREWKDRVIRWIAWGTASGAAGTLLCFASKEEGWIPVNKNLWSLSFVLVTTCFAFYLLSACYLLIDVKRWWNGSPFFYPGMNATIMYVGHSIAFQNFPWHWSIGPMNTHFMLLLESMWGTALWVLVAFWLHHIKFFLSL